MGFQISCLGDVKRASYHGGFFGDIVAGVRQVMLPAQWRALNDEVEGAARSGAVSNFRSAAGLTDARHVGYVFQDSDLYKWLEAAAYQLNQTKDADLEAKADSLIDLIAKAQMPDGYLNTYYQLTDTNLRWTNLKDNHELYCLGHLIEAATAYYQATGKAMLLDVARRFADHVDAVFGREEGKLRGYPGHEEIELALCKLYDVTGESRYLRLAQYFIDERGAKPNYFIEEQRKLGKTYTGEGPFGLTYAQHHLPPRQQETAEGHAVRALYLLTGMADTALRTDDTDLLDACKKVYRNITEKRMYLTGGVGSSHIAEAFTFDYDLPGDTAYAETCAAIALVFFCRRMLDATLDSDYADTMERALYNGCLSGMSLDTERFFYVNPLSVWPEASYQDARKAHVLPERPKWFGCACCPPNLARLLSSLGYYQYSASGREMRMHLYIQGDAIVSVNGMDVAMNVQTDYPLNGIVRVHMGKGDYDLRLRIPGWCEAFTVTMNGRTVTPEITNGYALIKGPFDGDELILSMPMQPRRVYAHPAVRDAVGKTAVMMGSVVYCLEEKDNGPNLHLVSLPKNAALEVADDPALLSGTRVVRARGLRQPETAGPLYTSNTPPDPAETTLTFIPYHKWANRGANEMTVWIREV
jgi:DUF1680 family protein